MIKIWDGFIRFFHWSLVFMLATLYFSAENDYLAIHVLAGLTVLALVLSRLIWGFLGSENAKLSSLLHHPSQVLNSLKANTYTSGHNPAGSYMVLLFFILIGLQLLSGLASSDDAFTDGPLVRYLTSDYVEWATDIHHLTFDLLLVAIFIHLIAILGYQFKGQSLTKTMLTGSRGYGAGHQPKPPKLRSGWHGLMIFVVCWSGLIYLWGMDAVAELSL